MKKGRVYIKRIELGTVKLVDTKPKAAPAIFLYSIIGTDVQSDR